MEHFKLLQAAADDPGYLGLVRSGVYCVTCYWIITGALRGIGNLRSTEAFQFLKGRVHYGQEREEARPSAIEAFAEVVADIMVSSSLNRLNGLTRGTKKKP